MDAGKRITELITITSRLVETMEKEIQALKDNRPDDIEALLEGKASLSRAYESLVSGLAEASEEVAKVDPELRERLRELGAKLNTLSEENAQLLKVAIAVNRRLFDAVADAVKSSQPSPGTYSQSGAIDSDGNGKAPANVPLSLDRTL